MRTNIEHKREDATYVVAVRVLDEREGVVGDLVDELNALVLRRVVNAALEDTTAVTVRRDLDAVRRDGVVDELPAASARRATHANLDGASAPGCPRARACSGTSESRGCRSDP